MKKYLIAAAFILCAPQTILAQSEMFYVVLDNTTNQCTVMTNEPTRPKRLDTKRWANTPRRTRPKRLWTP